ncbi:MAG: PIN domain-containing protein [Deltaproteobacteria bacterium]
MSALVVDTSSSVAYLGRGDGDHLDEALDEGRVHLPPIVAAELISGRMTAGQRRTLEQLLADLPLCATGLDHWVRVGRLRAVLAARGLQVSTPDAHVAQCALDLRGALLTEDAVFARIARIVPLRLA